MFTFKWRWALMRGFFVSCGLGAVLNWGTLSLQAATPQEGPYVAPASNAGELEMKQFALPAGFKVSLFAAEPDLANPVAFYIDDQDRFYVCETFREGRGVLDTRGHLDWLDEDLACRDVSDRVLLLKRHLSPQILAHYHHFPERVQLIEDRNGDGRADFSTIFAGGFNQLLDGIGAGVIARGNKVWYTCIPNLWFLQDTNGDGVADVRRSLAYGFGVRVGYLGHDLHGPRFGPDGKLYFSIGDRGTHVRVGDKWLDVQDTGAVYRCNPDGTDLELFAYGLRNPQDLIFDEYGDLFTGDNNADGGDHSRIVYLVKGGDSGWRCGYQWINRPVSRGPWNEEKLWYPQWKGQAAYIVPPAGNLAAGPSGITYYPGTGLPTKYRHHFFLVDFRGGSANSGVHTFTLKRKGAGFEMDSHEHFIWHVLATDVDFGVDGGIYLSDWVEGWNMTGKGRIYHVYDPATVDTPVVRQTKKLLAEGFSQRSNRELGRLLGHPNQRVRQDAQFALAARGKRAVKTFRRVLGDREHRLARLHAIWGLGQIGQSDPSALRPVVAVLRDQDPEVRAQAAKVLGEDRDSAAFGGLVSLLEDSQSRVRFFAAISLGELGNPRALDPLLQLLRENGDQDPYLRHAGVMGLCGIRNKAALLAHADDSSPAVRMGILLVLRRWHRTEIRGFLKDSDPAIVLEAARAINDVPICGAIPDLAALIGNGQMPLPLGLRVVNANFRYGTQGAARALARFAARGNLNERLRAVAVEDLGMWDRPPGRDRVTGLWRPIAGQRPKEEAIGALQPVIAKLLKEGPEGVRIAAARAAGQLGMDAAGADLLALVNNETAGAASRTAALKALGQLKDKRLGEAVKVALGQSNEVLHSAAEAFAGQTQASGAVQQIEQTLAKGTLREKQAAVATLGTMKRSGADRILSGLLDQLLAGKLPKGLELDVVEAASKRKDPQVKAKLKQYDQQQAQRTKDPLAGYRDLLYGGDPSAGKQIFFERPEASCVRCHKINGQGGDVGPNLSHVASQVSREYILESILFPNMDIAKGFESLLVIMKDGSAHAGILKSENNQEVVLNSPGEGIVHLKKNQIQMEKKGLSPMPEGLGSVLSKQDLRNLVAFLSSLK